MTKGLFIAAYFGMAECVGIHFA